ncbi:DAK2 domain-containing protein [Streptomyces sp. GMY01]|uniref:DAK2 domain-containing protein n=1 Tax=Streptomyces sp. GMY02 TaxID=1333528 RepID=UPI00146AC30A|nr:DAK2 domain-containing protein [Streptomyces sp. GMY02]NMO32560.1 DAK2 domain-containing protein [Streptomyces sp. GMY02]
MAAEDPAQALFRPGPSLGLRCRPVQQLEEAQVAQTFDAPAVRTWCGLALRALGRAREEIDAINVYPVADGDTGTNLYLTVESAVAAVEAVFAAHETGAGASDGLPGGPSLAEAARAMAHGALIGARGNSGTILAQLLRGMAEVLAADGDSAHTGGHGLRTALRRAADSARLAVARPVEGTVLTVASAAADAADGAEGDCGTVARAAYEGARTALAATPGQLAALGRAGVVDAGGRGLVAVLGALVETFTGEAVAGTAAVAATGTAGTAVAAVTAPDGAGAARPTVPHARVRGAAEAGGDGGAGAEPEPTSESASASESASGSGADAGAAVAVAAGTAGGNGTAARAGNDGGDPGGTDGGAGAYGGAWTREGACGEAGGVPPGGAGGGAGGGTPGGACGGAGGGAPDGVGGGAGGGNDGGVGVGGGTGAEIGLGGGVGGGTGAEIGGAVEPAGPGGCASSASAAPVSGPAFEVIYLLEADDDAVARLRQRLDALGDSLVVVGGDGLWNVHVHVDDAGAAVEAGVEAGRPHRIRITHFGVGDAHAAGPGRPPRERAQRAVVAVVPGEGLAGLCAEAGATTVLARPGEPPASGELVEAVRRAHAREVVLLPNDAELRDTAAAAAEQARGEGVRVALIPTRSAVQGLAALAVHEPGRRFDEDVVAMTSAAGATRHAEVIVAEHESWTSAGVCQAGDVLGLIDGDVAVIGSDVTATARTVLDRMLAAGGELVTLVLGDDAPDTVAAHLERRVRDAYLAVDTVTYHGGRQGALLLIGVE